MNKLSNETDRRILISLESSFDVYNGIFKSFSPLNQLSVIEKVIYHKFTCYHHNIPNLNRDRRWSHHPMRKLVPMEFCYLQEVFQIFELHRTKEIYEEYPYSLSTW